MSTRLLIKNINCSNKETLIGLIKDKFSDIVVTDVHVLFKDAKFRHCAFVGVKSREDAKKLQSLDGFYLGTSRVKVEYARSIFEEQTLKEQRTTENENEIIEEEEVAVEESNEQVEVKDVDSLDVINAISETSRLYITNIPYDCVEKDLLTYFKKFGPIADIHVPIDKLTKKPKGIAFVQFMSGIDAVKLYCLGGEASRKKYKKIQEMNFKPPSSVPTLVYSGRNIFIYPGEPQLNSTAAPTNLKEQRLMDKKKVSQLGFNWNTLYLNPNAVVSNMAKKMNMTEDELLNVHEKGAAVRMSVAEAEELSSLKNWFEENDVSASAFKNYQSTSNDDFVGHDERSDKILLIKNINPKINVTSFVDMYKKYGDVVKALIPPTRTVAIIEFAHATEAKIAFKATSYKPYDGLPLYLEWAPKKTFKKKTDPNKPKFSIGHKDPIAVNEQVLEGESQESASVFVKNINFATTDTAFEKSFKYLTGFKKAIMKTKQNKRGELLSMGYGFVEFDTHKHAEDCIRKYSDLVLDGHKLILRLSQRDTNASIGDKRKASDVGEASTKVVIKNVPFEATRQEIHELVSTVCSIQSIRLPKKYDGGHRGFCFVECQSKADAKQLIEKMNGVHLYGRHLVFMFSGIETNKSRKVAAY